MEREDLIRNVALRMDEATPEATLSLSAVELNAGSDGNPLYMLIDGLIDDAVLELFSVAPYWRLPQTEFNPTTEILVEAITADVGSRRMIRLKLNDDFLRVAEINCSSFQRPITEVFPEQSPEGHRQHNRYLMGREAKPVGILSHGKWGDDKCREIDCYSVENAPDSITAFYIAKPEAIVAGVVNGVEAKVPPVLIPALEWLIASRTFGARGDTNHAAICQQNAQNLIM